MKYDSAQRAFLVHRLSSRQDGPVTIWIASTAERPLGNPVFVVDHWNPPADVRVDVGGKEAIVPVRTGIEHHLDGDSLVVYLELTTTEPVQVSVRPAIH